MLHSRGNGREVRRRAFRFSRRQSELSPSPAFPARRLKGRAVRQYRRSDGTSRRRERFGPIFNPPHAPRGRIAVPKTSPGANWICGPARPATYQKPSKVKSAGFALEQISAIHLLVCGGGRISAVHRRHAVSFMREILDTGIHKSVEIVEAALFRQISVQRSQVPFAVNPAGKKTET